MIVLIMRSDIVSIVLAIIYLITYLPVIHCDHSRITFSGYDWIVKIGYRMPGPNHFADIPFVYDGKLFLIASRSNNGSWITSEVFSTRKFGYGTYRFNVSSELGNLHPNVVLGLFTWDWGSDYAHREIDVEFAKWGQKGISTNAQYVVQPHQRKSNLKRFYRKVGLRPTIEQFTWSPEKISFASLHDDRIISSWVYKGPNVPKKGNESVHMNVWLWKGRGPSDNKPIVIVINSFEFIPL
ncbi:uncharacterized protein LOC141854710 [Brevipalpus obovatus]|uniref:uncharacterized protein LOC141854710 n=1 Tax=Brevipalpus obovatus TaxID=246614 RepID=UPI003D9E5667